MQAKRPAPRADITQPIRIRWTGQQGVIPRPRPPMNQVGARPGMIPPAPRPMPRPANRPQTRNQPKQISTRPLLWGLVGIGVMALMSCAALTLGMGLVYAGGILPAVSAGGVPVGGLSQEQAEQEIAAEWQTITVRDEGRAWEVNPTSLGLSIDAGATARAAYDAGRGDLFNLLSGILGGAEIEPVLSIDLSRAQAGLQELASQFEQPAVNAGVRLVNGQVETTAPVNGRVLDIQTTLARLQQAETLADGVLELAMQAVQPSVLDASPMLQQARHLLSQPLDIRVYDPITGDSVYWSVQPETWAAWLTSTPDSSSATGLALTANPAPVRDYLNAQASRVLDSSRYLEIDEGIADVQASIEAGRTTPTLRVYHHDRQHVVQPGETITSIAWDYGVPYLYIQQANGGASNLSVGQTITIPSADQFLPYPPVADKRIVVSISQQRAWVYENGGLKWEWLVSTGINDSPTWPGIYQIISHEPNAYAGNWNLWMPNFMGVYQPIPGSDFTNGFHGFPTRGNSQLLWTNSLGTRVTYGCILLSNENAQLLYNWAEEGVVVEIRA